MEVCLIEMMNPTFMSRCSDSQTFEAFLEKGAQVLTLRFPERDAKNKRRWL
jgi:hypothetical protein